MEAEANIQNIQPKRLPSAFSLINPSFEALKLNINVVLGFLVYIFAFGLIATLLMQADGVALLGILFGVVGMIGLLILAPVVPYVQLMSAKGTKVTIKQSLDAGMKRFWRFYGLSILVGLLIIGGLILLIIPGIFMFRRYYLASFYLYDQDLGISAAMKKSAEDSKQYAGSIWGLIGVNLLFSLIGVVPLIGQLISTVLQVVYSFAPAIRYLEIKNARA